LFQSTPPRGGRRVARCQADHCRSVSIHAPAWGATRQGGIAGPCLDVSIHAPAWGATLRTDRRGDRAPCFNPRPRVGGDFRRSVAGAFDCVFQSTPPRGGRHSGHARHRQRPSFNPRPRVGGDLDTTHITLRVRTFQSTPPRGGRHVVSREWAKVFQFQSTPPRGGRRHCANGLSPVELGFQSTPPRGGRRHHAIGLSIHPLRFNPRPRVGGDQERRGVGRPFAVSIHAPAWGATTGRWHGPRPGRSFNPRPRVGGDFSGRHSSTQPCLFQSTPPRGGRQPRGCSDVHAQRVSIHAPAWGATIRQPASTTPRRGVSIHAPAWGATRPAVRCG